MHIVFVNHNIYSGNSGIHVHPLANAFCELGNAVTVYLPQEVTNDRSYFGEQQYIVRGFNDTTRLSHDGDILFVAWTPRELVRKKTLELAAQYKAPYVVHLEDNEEQMLSDHLKLPFEKIAQMGTDELDKIVPNNLSHPVRYKQFLANACAVTTIIDTLIEFVPNHVPTKSFWPACEQEIFDFPLERDTELLNDFGFPPDANVVFYPGNVHASNKIDVESLYQAIELLNNMGKQVFLVRAGTNYVQLSSQIDQNKYFYVELGEVAPADTLRYIKMADVLVQPGVQNKFNNYRFPCKLPMFLASGRPTITSNANVGTSLKDWEHCLKIVSLSPYELCLKIKLLLERKQLSHQIGKGGRSFARRHFNWQNSAECLEQFYQKTAAF